MSTGNMSSYQLSSRQFSIPTSREKDRVTFSESYSGKESEFWRGVIFADHMRFRFVTFHKNVYDVYLTYMFPMLPPFSLNRSGLAVIYEGNETSDLPNTAAVWGFFTADEKKEHEHFIRWQTNLTRRRTSRFWIE
jgi:hypothetical protein